MIGFKRRCGKAALGILILASVAPAFAMASDGVSDDFSAETAAAQKQTLAQAQIAQNDTVSERDTASGLLQLINKRDRGQDANGNYLSPNAPAEYNRILGLLASVQAKRQNGDPNNPNYLSVALVNDYISQIKTALAQAQAGLDQIQAAPNELASKLILLVPGTPAFNGNNPTSTQVADYIAQRQTYWGQQQADYEGMLNSISAQLDPNNTAMTVNDFGEAEPVSKISYLARDEDARSQAARQIMDLTAAIDARAADIMADTGAKLPRLSGLSYNGLIQALPSYRKALAAIPSPSAERGYYAHAEEQIAEMLGPLADATVQLGCTENTEIELAQSIIETLPQAAHAFVQAAAMAQAIIADGQQDLAYLNTPLPADPARLALARQELINRKLALLQGAIIPDLTVTQTFLQQTLLPYAQAKVAQASPKPNGSNLAYCYSQKIQVYNTIRSLGGR